jgi:MFS family permease
VTGARRIGCVLLPFAAGYYLSYLFRTINALIAADLTADLSLTAADLGLLTSVYFLVFAAAQIPFGILLDRHGPRTLLAGLLLLASAGSLLFAIADTLLGLLAGRALIGLGVALALMGGFKAIVLWFPIERLALTNGWFVALGALGAVTATAPAELLVGSVGWRGLFAVLGALSALAALIIVGLVPDRDRRPAAATAPQPGLTLGAIYRHRGFWRLAPLSSLGVGTSWSLQGLWAAPWLRDVDGLDRAGVVEVLSLMAIAVSAGGLALGVIANQVRRRGGRTKHMLLGVMGPLILAQLGLCLKLPLPASLAWGAIAAAGAATVLSYAILADTYPREVSGRANAALNLLHVGCAFALQSLMGLIIQQWPAHGEHYPAAAHVHAMAVVLALELAALAWFFVPVRRRAELATRSALAMVTRAPSSHVVGVAAPARLENRHSVAEADRKGLSPGPQPASPRLQRRSEAALRAKTPVAARPIRRTSRRG